MAKIDSLVDTSITGGGKLKLRKGDFVKTEKSSDLNEIIEKYNTIVANPHYEIKIFIEKSRVNKNNQ